MIEDNIRDRVNTLIKYLSRIISDQYTLNKTEDLVLELSTIDEYCDIYMENNLSDSALDSFDKMTNTLSKYKSKMAVLGKQSFKVNAVNLNDKLCITLICPELLSESKWDIDRIAYAVDFILNIDYLCKDIEFKERILYKALHLSVLDRLFNDTDEITPKLVKLYKPKRLMYISPLEYYYNSFELSHSMSNIISYVMIEVRETMEEMFDRNIETSDDRIKSLGNDLNTIVNDLLDFEINSHQSNELRFSEDTTFDIDIVRIVSLKIWCDIINDNLMLRYINMRYARVEMYRPVLYNKISKRVEDIICNCVFKAMLGYPKTISRLVSNNLISGSIPIERTKYMLKLLKSTNVICLGKSNCRDFDLGIMPNKDFINKISISNINYNRILKE